jgi:hypothetical protein
LEGVFSGCSAVRPVPLFSRIDNHDSALASKQHWQDAATEWALATSASLDTNESSHGRASNPISHPLISLRAFRAERVWDDQRGNRLPVRAMLMLRQSQLPLPLALPLQLAIPLRSASPIQQRRLQAVPLVYAVANAARDRDAANLLVELLAVVAVATVVPPVCRQRRTGTRRCLRQHRQQRLLVTDAIVPRRARKGGSEQVRHGQKCSHLQRRGVN